MSRVEDGHISSDRTFFGNKYNTATHSPTQPHPPTHPPSQNEDISQFPVLRFLLHHNNHSSLVGATPKPIIVDLDRPSMTWMDCLFRFLSVFFVLTIPIVAAQNYTACDPTKNDKCPPDPGFLSATTSVNFNESYPDGVVSSISQNTITRDGSGLHITINSIGERPFIETNSVLSRRLF